MRVRGTYVTILIATVFVCVLLLFRQHEHTLSSVGEYVKLALFADSNSWLQTQNTSYHVTGPLFKTKPLVIWSNDYHISPINDLKHLLRPLGVKFIDKSLSGHCHITNTCKGRQSLRVINMGNAMDLQPTLIPKFFEAYHKDAEMQSVDAFVCFHPTSMCELFEPFNKSLIIIASTRYELGRRARDRWIRWNENIRRYSLDKKNVIAGNNLYDAEYIKYFTGVQTRRLTSYCGYIKDKYTQTRPGFIVAPIHHGGLNGEFFVKYDKFCREANCSVEVFRLREKYKNYKYSDLAAHQGIIYVPYQVSVMSFFEQYRMNIPLFCPSPSLLASWQRKHMVMGERTWVGTFGGRPSNSTIPPHPSQAGIPDPNNEMDETAIHYWIKFSDYFQFPHVTYYDSVEHLAKIINKLTPANLWRTSQLMKEYNAAAKDDLISTWKDILLNVAKHSPNHPH